MYFVNGCVNVNVNVYSETHRSHNLHIPKLRANNQKLRANNQFVRENNQKIRENNQKIRENNQIFRKIWLFSLQIGDSPKDTEIRRFGGDSEEIT